MGGNTMEKYNDGFDLDDENFMSRGKKLNSNTLKPYGKLDVQKTTKLTPLLKD
jgi:hypothetical protein